MSDRLVIRPLAKTDYDQWKVLWDGYNAFYGREGPTALAPEITETTWGRFFDPALPIHALVAEQDGKLVGIAHYLYHLNPLAVKLHCYLSDLFTLPSERGRGVGRALIEAVYAAARAADAGRVYWTTHETNATAMQLYNKVAEKSGFLVYRKML